MHRLLQSLTLRGGRHGNPGYWHYTPILAVNYLHRLPGELLFMIVEYLSIEDQKRLCCTSKFMSSLTAPVLYRHVIFRSRRLIPYLLRTLLKRPHLRPYIRTIHISGLGDYPFQYPCPGLDHAISLAQPSDYGALELCLRQAHHMAHVPPPLSYFKTISIPSLTFLAVLFLAPSLERLVFAGSTGLEPTFDVVNINATLRSMLSRSRDIERSLAHLPPIKALDLHSPFAFAMNTDEAHRRELRSQQNGTLQRTPMETGELLRYSPLLANIEELRVWTISGWPELGTILSRCPKLRLLGAYADDLPTARPDYEGPSLPVEYLEGALTNGLCAVSQSLESMTLRFYDPVCWRKPYPRAPYINHNQHLVRDLSSFARLVNLRLDICMLIKEPGDLPDADVAPLLPRSLVNFELFETWGYDLDRDFEELEDVDLLDAAVEVDQGEDEYDDGADDDGAEAGLTSEEYTRDLEAMLSRIVHARRLSRLRRVIFHMDTVFWLQSLVHDELRKPEVTPRPGVEFKACWYSNRREYFP